MTANKVDTFHFTVEPFEDDFMGRLSWNTLGKHVLSCADKHATARHFNRIEHNGHRCLWVLSRIVFEMDSWPRLGDDYSISTWVVNYYRYFTNRCFDIRDAEDKVIGRVFTIWAMIDEETRKPQMLNTLFDKTFDPYIEKERPCEVQPLSRIRIQGDTPHFSRRTYYSDIDENNHVNSIRYIEFILDTFPKETFRNQSVKRLELAYNSESYAEEDLDFYREAVTKDTFHIIIKNKSQHNATVCGCAITFQPTASTP